MKVGLHTVLRIVQLFVRAWGSPPSRKPRKGTKQSTDRAAVSPNPVKRLRQEAERGDAEAQYDLGLLYENGEGVPQNHAEAAKWYQKAAEQGDADAQFDLGGMYYYGLDGVRKNHTSAAKWYRKAAEQGHARAQFNLGGMYRDGEGVPRHRIKAYAWYVLASVEGEASREARDELGKELTPAQIAEGQELAAQLQEQISARQEREH